MLAGNALTGTIRAKLEEMRSVEQLDVPSNQFTGAMIPVDSRTNNEKERRFHPTSIICASDDQKLFRNSLFESFQVGPCDL
jgi:hypothetical protein